MKPWHYLMATGAIIAIVFATFYVLGAHPGGERSGVFSRAAWQRMASPGSLSRSHAFLEHDCAACHTPMEGPDAAKCTACHADNELLLQRQSTTFHADIGNCRACHREHRGAARRPTDMSHEAVARIGLRQGDSDGQPPDIGASSHDRLRDWIESRGSTDRLPSLHPELTAREAVLNCASCHANEDPHFKLFGQDCARCHTTSRWTISQFRHPSPRSTDCAMSPSPAEPLHGALPYDLGQNGRQAARPSRSMFSLPSNDLVERHPGSRLVQTPLTEPHRTDNHCRGCPL